MVRTVVSMCCVRSHVDKHQRVYVRSYTAQVQQVSVGITVRVDAGILQFFLLTFLRILGTVAQHRSYRSRTMGLLTSCAGSRRSGLWVETTA